MNAESPEKKQLRLLICELTANVIASICSRWALKYRENVALVGGRLGFIKTIQ
jgi:hypothetical protein